MKPTLRTYHSNRYVNYKTCKWCGLTKELSEFDPTDFTLRTHRNGEFMQEGDPGDMIFGVAYQLADLCRLITLEPGDVVEIDGIGRLSNTVEEWQADLLGPGVQPETLANTLHVALAVSEEEAGRMVVGGRYEPAGAA